jgi:hypothetical protein
MSANGIDSGPKTYPKRTQGWSVARNWALSTGAKVVCLLRMGRDSNSRDGFPSTRFPVLPYKNAGQHPRGKLASIIANLRARFPDLPQRTRASRTRSVPKAQCATWNTPAWIPAPPFAVPHAGDRIAEYWARRGR